MHFAKNNIAEFCDGFCESTAFTSEEIDKIIERAELNVNVLSDAILDTYNIKKRNNKSYK